MNHDTSNQEPSMIAARRPRKLTRGERNRLLGLTMGFLLGLIGVGITSIAVTLGSHVRGIGPDHWTLWLLRVAVILVVILLSTFTVFYTRLRPQAEDSKE